MEKVKEISENVHSSALLLKKQKYD